MTNEDITEAQKLIASMREDLSSIAAASEAAAGLKGLADDAHKLFAIVPESVRDVVEMIHTQVQVTRSWVVYVQQHPDHKPRLPEETGKMVKEVRSGLDQIEQSLK